MSDLLKAYNLATHRDFVGAVTAAAHKSANYIMNDTQEKRAGARGDYAVYVLSGGNVMPLVWECAMNPTVVSKGADDGGLGSIPDSDIEYVVSAVWDVVASRGRTAA